MSSLATTTCGLNTTVLKVLAVVAIPQAVVAIPHADVAIPHLVLVSPHMTCEKFLVVSMLLYAHLERVSVCCMCDFFLLLHVC